MKVAIQCKCPICGQKNIVFVELEDYYKWTSGAGLVQEIFPYLFADERELLVSGICGSCWDTYINVPEKEEDEIASEDELATFKEVCDKFAEDFQNWLFTNYGAKDDDPLEFVAKNVQVQEEEEKVEAASDKELEVLKGFCESHDKEFQEWLFNKHNVGKEDYLEFLSYYASKDDDDYYEEPEAEEEHCYPFNG